MNWPDELVCAHELGHLISAKELGLESQGIKLIASWWSGEITSGYCDLRGFMHPTPGDNPEPGGWDKYRGMLVMTAGGQAAAERWFTLNDLPIEDTTRGTDGDYAMFHKDAPLMPNAPSWDQAMDEARNIIVSRWDEVVALTPVLLEKHRLAGSKV